MVTEYQYNSQDQVINYTHKGSDNFKRFRNIYDYTGRLYQVDHFYEPGEEDNPDYYANLLEYNYNENSQTEMLKFNIEMENEYFYNNRNWITAMTSNKTAFDYTNSYFRNGNVKTTEYSGEYNNDFGNSSDLTFTYEYDRSNRLLDAVTHDNKFEISNSYDKDGNILTLDRKGSAGSSVDDFNYSYYSGTNKIRAVQGSKDQFIYDYNGNLITDSLNSNFSIHYDHRNLITDLIHRVILISGITPADTSFNKTYYYYDEAGNRIRKIIFNDENDSLLSDIIYSRDISGKEMAIYENESLKQWNIWGADNAGFINANGDKRYYLKDHLGSVRAVLDENETVISSQDYDAWGYQLQDRNYDSDVSIYKFTSKERDEENLYDYFGARYYDARIGRWGSIDPLLEKHYDFSSYNYVLDNPLIFYDPDGRQVYLGGESYQESISQGQYINVNETQFTSQNRFDVKRPRESGLTTTDVGLMDPVEWFSGGVVTLSMRLSTTVGMSITEKLVDKTLKNIGKTSVSETSSKKTINEIGESFIEFLGEGAQGHFTKAGKVNKADVYFLSKDKLRTIRFDLKSFKPHDKPHIDVEQKVLNESGQLDWEKVTKFWIKEK